MAVSATLRPGEYFAGYQILRKLGAGGMGAVYQARDRDLPRFVALKLLSLPDDGALDSRARFRREADTVARLQHPNIVTVYARGEEADQLWIAMTFVDGSDVARALREGAMHPARAVRIISETAAALDHAHETGILHRDVKPANILLTEGRPERALLTDFGIAKAFDESRQLTQGGEILASFQYAAPERLTRPGEVDPRADVYSLGCTLFHMLTGQPPYPGQNVGQIIYGHAYEPIPLPSHRNPALPRGFDEVITRALAKEPDHRFANCAELARSAAQVTRQGPPPPRTGPQPKPGPQPRTGPPPHPKPPPQTGPARTSDHLSGPRFATTRTAPGVPTGPPPTIPAPPQRQAAPSGPPPEPPERTGRGDTGPGIGTGPPPPPKRDTTFRIMIGLAVVTALALVSYFVFKFGDGHPSLSSATTTGVVPVTTTAVVSPTTLTTTETPYTTTTWTSPTTTTAAPPKAIVVPDVVGSPIATAKTQLEKEGFVVKEVQREDKHTKGTVVALDPAAGTSHPVGSTVTVYVSSGPATTITMPTLVGLSVADATGALQKLGWKGTITPTYVKTTDTAKSGKITDQNPAAGTTIARDAPVTVSVGQVSYSSYPS
ncbi:hypothetical protein NS14008_13320 [Nocardia seriolae]|nr:hypothetical protein NS14008_13320 [Nocardia seriolae]PSK28973.1 serine/threonine-protein kinase [Nocardia seriolae]